MTTMLLLHNDDVTVDQLCHHHVPLSCLNGLLCCALP
jgi:hypothetical protein